MPDPADPRLEEAARTAVLERHRRDGATAWIQAGGRSMRPLVAAGDWLCVEFGAAPVLGDVVVTTAPGGRHVAHRVVALRGDALVTKGDAEPYCDAPVSRADVLGVVRAVAPSPEHEPTTATLGGRRGVALARVSHASGRVAGRARRLLLRLPSRRRAAALRVLAGAALAASRGSAAAVVRRPAHRRPAGGR